MKKSQWTKGVLLAFLCIPLYNAPVIADELESELQDLQGQIDQSRSEQASWQKIIETVSLKIKAIQTELDAATEKLKSIQQEQEKINQEIRQTEQEIMEAEIKLRARQDVLNRRVRAIYMNGQLNYLQVIMGATNFSDFANRMELLKRIIRSDFNLILEIKQKKANIEAKKQFLISKKKEIDVLALEAKKTHQKIADKKSEQQSVMEEARSQKEAAAAMEADLIARSNEVQALIRQRQASSTVSPSSQGSGVFIWPCSGPITSPFGYRVHPIFGTTIYHSGIDIGVDYGTSVLAADGGIVIYAGWISGYGNTVIIDHGNGLQTLYGHNTSVNVSEGQAVSKGDVVAYSGSTGNSTGPHLHFEVRSGGSPVDPMGYL